MKRISNIVKENFRMCIEFSISDFKKRYSGSALGVAWPYIQTTMLILVYWIVFQFGLRIGNAEEGIPFLLWFISAFIPWCFFSDCVNSAIGCMLEYSYVVKKVVFNVSIIPLSKIYEMLLIYVPFFVLTVVISALYGVWTGVYLLQIIYYLVALVLLIIPLVYWCSAVNVFFKDFSQLVGVILNILMWATPILWNFTIVEPEYRLYFMINPMFYITNGFRETIIHGTFFLNNIWWALYFWTVVVILWLTMIPVYRRLTPHMADVL